MPSKEYPIGGGIRGSSQAVISTGNTDARRPGDRRFGLSDRRLVAREKPSDRRAGERRDT
jgi:hypothetical protein